MQPSIRGAAIAAVCLTFASRTRSEERVPCSARIDRATVATCAVAASLAVQAERHELDAVEGRKLSVSPLLPSNPVLSGYVARRAFQDGTRATNWQVTLAQELEIAGQRGARRQTVDAEKSAQEMHVELVRRDVAAAAWVAFFDVVAAVEMEHLASSLVATGEAVATAVRARAEEGLIAPVDADVADAALLRLSQAKLTASRQAFASRAALQTLLGLEPDSAPIAVDGKLDPLAGVETTATTLLATVAAQSPEVRALDAERRSLELRADALRRSRIPNPTISAFVQNDGFNERVLGIGLGLPIPIPGLVGRTYVGEIAEAEARGRRAQTDRDWTARQVRLMASIALNDVVTRRAEVDAFTPEKIARAEQTLKALAQEIAAGRMAVRDAVVTQQTMIELLQAHVAARRALCIASVNLARTVGLPLDRGNL